MQNAGQSMAASFGAATAAIGGALGFAVKKSMDFEAQIDRVGAVAGATPAEIKKLEQAALDLGASTSKSATEVAQGMEIMAAMGYNTNQILAAMPGIISAAEASGEDMALVAETVSAALNAFGLSASEASRVADVLAQAANDSAAGVQDMQYTFKYAAPIAKQLGISLEQLAAATEIMANNGIKGEQAGTTLRAALIRLSDPPKEAANTLERLGVKITDANGKMLPFSNIIGQLAEKTKNMSNAQKLAALSTIFGTEAASGMLSVVEAGPQKLDALTKSLQNSAGASQEAAAKMKDNLKGSLEELQGAFETAQITIGNALAPAIEKVAGYIQNLINWFNNLSPSTQKTIATIGAVSAVLAALGAAIGVVLAIIGAAASGIGALTAAFGAVSSAIAVAGGMAGVFSAAIAAITGPVGIAIAAITGLVAAGVAIYKNWDEIKAKAIEIWGAIKDWFSQTLESIKQFFNNAWNNIKSFTSSTWDSIKQTTVNVWNAIKTGVMAIITPFINGIKNLFNGMKDGLQSIMNGLKQFFDGIWKAIKNIFLGAVLLIVDLVTGDFKNLSNDARAIFNNLKNALSSIWNGIKQVFSGAVSAIKGFVGAAWSNIKSTTSSVFNGIRSLASSIWNGIKSAISNAVNTAKSAVSNAFSSMKSAVSSIMSNIKSTITSMWNSAVNFLKGIDLYSIGKNIIQGLARGISSMASAVIEKVRDIANSVTRTIRKVLDIHSPSRETEKLGKHTGEGFAKGIESKKSNVEAAAKKTAESAKKAFEEAFNSAKYQFQMGQINASQYIDKLESIRNAYAKTADQVRKVNLEIRKIEQQHAKELEELAKQRFENDKKWFEEKKYYNQLSLADELKALEKVAQKYKQGTEERIYWEREIYRVKKEISDRLTQINDEYVSKIEEANKRLAESEKQLTEEYNRAVEDRTRSLYSFAGLFDEIKTESDVTGEQLLANLENQVKAFEEWQKNLQTLIARGLDEGLIQELQELGPKAFAEIAALTTLSDEQLQEYAELWRQKHELAKQQAVNELEGMRQQTQEKIQQLRTETEKELEQYKTEWIAKIKEIKEGSKTTLQDWKTSMQTIGADAMTGLKEGMESMMGPLLEKAREIADAIRSTIQSALDINSPSRVMMELGKWIPLGLAEGINRNINAVVSATNRMAQATIPSVPKLAAGASGYGTMQTNNITKYGNVNINVTIPVNDLEQIRTVNDFFTRLGMKVRQA
jgi:TP901 family phage tail tape measure protein